MITLYVRTGCPYCAAVLQKIHEDSIPYAERNISDPLVVEELIAKGGKRQTPFMVDDETGVSMYESNDIIQYLSTKYPSQSPQETAE